jgi:hypothetical protein
LKSDPNKKQHGGARAGAGKPQYEPTAADRATVKNLIVCGYTQEQIAKCLATAGISKNTLRKHFRRELDSSKAEVDAFATSALINGIKNGNTTLLIFFLKSRCGWQETTAQRFVDQSGRDRPFMLADADRLISEADAEDGGK